MTSLAKLILATILVCLPVRTQEPWHVRSKRMQTIARAIDVESAHAPGPMPRKTLIASTLSVWFWESRLSSEVHAGKPTKWGSDVGKARCFGQIHRHNKLTQKQWEQLAGTDLAATRRCAAETMRLLQMFARYCNWKGDDASFYKLFGAYATGMGCGVTKHGPRRTATVRDIQKELGR